MIEVAPSATLTNSVLGITILLSSVPSLNSPPANTAKELIVMIASSNSKLTDLLCEIEAKVALPCPPWISVVSALPSRLVTVNVSKYITGYLVTRSYNVTSQTVTAAYFLP